LAYTAHGRSSMAKNDFDELMSVGVDIGKDVFHLVGFNKEGQLVLAA
jgi:transposase